MEISEVAHRANSPGKKKLFRIQNQIIPFFSISSVHASAAEARNKIQLLSSSAGGIVEASASNEITFLNVD